MNSRGLGNSFLQGWLYSLEEKKKKQAETDRLAQEANRDNRQFTQGIIGKQIGSAIDTQAEIGKEKRTIGYNDEFAKKNSASYQSVLQQLIPDYTPTDKILTKDAFDAIIEYKKIDKTQADKLAYEKFVQEGDINLETLRGKNDVKVQGMRNLPEPPKIITDEENFAARQLINTIKPDFQFENRKYSMDEAKQYNLNYRDTTGVTKPVPKEVPLSAKSNELYAYAKTLKPEELQQSMNGGELAQLLESLPVSDDEAYTLRNKILRINMEKKMYKFSQPKDKSFDTSNILGQESPSYKKGKMIGYYK